MNLDLANAVAFWVRIIPIIDLHRGWCYSAGRSAERNAELPGSAEKSRHIVWCAGDFGFHDALSRDEAWADCYAAGLHGYKKEFNDPETGARVWGFHMQDLPGKPR